MSWQEINDSTCFYKNKIEGLNKKFTNCSYFGTENPRK